ncbi:reverse transcriptase domain-containing protein [Tanacetum coccineum]
MSTREQYTPTISTSAVRNTGGRSGPQGLEEPTSDEVLRELCDKNYHQLLPLIAEKMQNEKEQQDKLNAVKARLLYGDESERNPRNHEESHYSESKTLTARTEPRRRHGSKHFRSPSPIASVFRRLRRNRPPSPRPRPRKEGGVFNRLGEKNKAHPHVLTAATRVPKRREPRCNQGSTITGAHRPGETSDIRRVKTAREVTGNPNQRGTCQTPTKMISLSLGRVRKETLSHLGSDILISQGQGCLAIEVGNANVVPYVQLNAHWKARAWFDKLPKESIDSYEDLRAAFRENYLQQTKHIKDPVEIHHIKQRDEESTEDFMERYKAEVLDVEGAPKCMKIYGFIHEITHPELIKREVAAFSHSRKKAPTSWRQPEGGNKPNFKKGFKNKQRSNRKPDRFSLLTKTPKEIFALEKEKFKAPPPMVTPVEKRNSNKYCEFHADTGHSGRMHAAEKADRRNDQVRVAKQRVTQSFSPETIISFPLLGEEDETEGPMIIEAEIGGHFVHRIYVDRGASSEVLYEHCFVRLRPEIRSQMIPSTTSLIGFSGETIWPLGQISLLVKIGDEEHFTFAWMSFMVIMSPSQHNGIIGKTGIRKIRAVPSTTHKMLKFLVEEGTVMLRSNRVIPMKCAMISVPSTQHPVTSQGVGGEDKSGHSS